MAGVLSLHKRTMMMLSCHEFIRGSEIENFRAPSEIILQLMHCVLLMALPQVAFKVTLPCDTGIFEGP